jgi:metal-responsive CopG/Arc/MetJ family transcriptional regulator
MLVMKTAISIPDDVFRAAERTAKRLGMSRSELFSRAAIEFLKENPPDDLTASYDAGFSEEETDDRLLAHRRRAARTALRKVEWK